MTDEIRISDQEREAAIRHWRNCTGESKKPESCYDCADSNDCELFEQNCFREKTKIIVLANSRFYGCPYDKETD